MVLTLASLPTGPTTAWNNDEPWWHNANYKGLTMKQYETSWNNDCSSNYLGSILWDRCGEYATHVGVRRNTHQWGTSLHISKKALVITSPMLLHMLENVLDVSRKRSQSWDFKGLQSSCSPGITCLLCYRLQRLRQLHLPRRHQGYKSRMYKFCVPKPPSNIGSQFGKWVKCITCLETHDHVGM